MSTLDEFEEDDEIEESHTDPSNKRTGSSVTKPKISDSSKDKSSLTDQSLLSKKSSSRLLTDAMSYKTKRIIPPEMKQVIHEFIEEELTKFKAEMVNTFDAAVKLVAKTPATPNTSQLHQVMYNKILALLNWEVLIAKIKVLDEDDYLRMTLPAPSPETTTPGKGKVHRRLKHITINLLELIRKEVGEIYSQN